MARYQDHNDMQGRRDVDWERIAAFYGFVIGLLLTKTGPVNITQRDIELYQVAGIRPFVESNDDIDGMKAYLLGEDEWPESSPNAPVGM